MEQCVAVMHMVLVGMTVPLYRNLISEKSPCGYLQGELFKSLQASSTGAGAESAAAWRTGGPPESGRCC